MYVGKLESEFKIMLDEALKWSQGVSPYDKQLFAPLKEKFDNIDECELDELDELIVEMKAKLNCLNVDPSAPEVYAYCMLI